LGGFYGETRGVDVALNRLTPPWNPPGWVGPIPLPDFVASGAIPRAADAGESLILVGGLYLPTAPAAVKCEWWEHRFARGHWVDPLDERIELKGKPEWGIRSGVGGATAPIFEASRLLPPMVDDVRVDYAAVWDGKSPPRLLPGRPSAGLTTSAPVRVSVLCTDGPTVAVFVAQDDMLEGILEKRGERWTLVARGEPYIY
jgi:hypothetical protein